MTTPFTILNDGAAIRSTDYWITEHARAGLLYLSGNAGALRLLVPDASAYMIGEMRTASEVCIERGLRTPQTWDIVFDDRSHSPFVITMDVRQMDRALTAGSCRFTVWTPKGMVLDMPCQIDQLT